MIIDFHTHIFPDDVASKAIPTLEQKGGIKAFTDGTIADTLEKMNSWGVDKIVALSIATNPKQQPKVNDFAISANSDKIISFGSVHPLSEVWESELVRIKNAGLKGIKLHPEYQEFEVDDQKVFKIYEKCKELDLIIVFHAGRDVAYPNGENAHPKKMRKMWEKFSENKFVISHLGGYLEWDNAEKYLSDTSLYIDTSLVAGLWGNESIERFIRKKGLDFVLLGSDLPWKTSSSAIQLIEELSFNELEKQKIYSENALKLLGLVK